MQSITTASVVAVVYSKACPAGATNLTVDNGLSTASAGTCIASITSAASTPVQCTGVPI